LDEIGLLPGPLQAKLLKVLEEQAVRRLGSTTSETIDVWILSATNADLGKAVRERGFREDLYHRLAVLTLSLPPLRERGRDVLLLAERFLARATAAHDHASGDEARSPPGRPDENGLQRLAHGRPARDLPQYLARAHRKVRSQNWIGPARARGAQARGRAGRCPARRRNSGGA